jgi:hypothetical protein
MYKIILIMIIINICIYIHIYMLINIYVHSSRAAVCTPHTDIHCKNLISEALKSAFNQFISKKNSRIAPKIFSELIQRFTDFSVFSFFKDLVLSCGSAKTSFLKVCIYMYVYVFVYVYVYIYVYINISI